MLNVLKNYTNSDRMDVAEIIALIAFGKSLKDEYEAMGFDTPDWLDRNLKALRREAISRNSDKIEAALREKKAKLEALATPAERKAKIQKEIAALEKQSRSISA